jgi:hypothetical protein
MAKLLSRRGPRVHSLRLQQLPRGAEFPTLFTEAPVNRQFDPEWVLGAQCAPASESPVAVALDGHRDCSSSKRPPVQQLSWQPKHKILRLARALGPNGPGAQIVRPANDFLLSR